VYSAKYSFRRKSDDQSTGRVDNKHAARNDEMKITHRIIVGDNRECRTIETAEKSRLRDYSGTGQGILTLWHRNFLLNFSTPCI